jgi:putative acetyltransferase
MGISLNIRESTDYDLSTVLEIESKAFGSDEEAALVSDLLGDPTAKPCLSLLAFIDGKAVGHILFTNARLEPDSTVSSSILAPLAVVPEAQGRGVGGALTRHGLEMLSNSGVDLVFVLGHIAYYPRFGFKPAGKLGFDAPYPIPEKNADAWMVQSLRDGVIGKYSGTVVCADKMNKPEYWRE